MMKGIRRIKKRVRRIKSEGVGGGEMREERGFMIGFLLDCCLFRELRRGIWEFAGILKWLKRLK